MGTFQGCCCRPQEFIQKESTDLQPPDIQVSASFQDEVEANYQHVNAITKPITLVYYPHLLTLLGQGWTESELCRIHTLNCKRFYISMPTGPELLKYTARQLKERIEDDHGIEVDSQVLRFRGRIFQDQEVLVSRGVIAGSSLLLGVQNSSQALVTDNAAETNSCTRTASYTPTLTQTVAVTDAYVESDVPWWLLDSRRSGPYPPPKTLQAAKRLRPAMFDQGTYILDSNAEAGGRNLSKDELRAHRLGTLGAS
jgi:hypothetical protein